MNSLAYADKIVLTVCQNKKSSVIALYDSDDNCCCVSLLFNYFNPQELLNHRIEDIIYSLDKI